MRCNRFEELENELPVQIKNATELFLAGELKEAKSLANSISRKNLQMAIPGLDEELRVLFKKIKNKRADSIKSIYAA